jgi:ribonuclease HII
MLQINYSGFDYECGTDEAGRGCLAGPVTACALIFPINLKEEIERKNVKKYFDLLNDSKKLTEKIRYDLRTIIEEIALTYSVTHLFPDEIDEINILNASMKAMQESVLKLSTVPEYIIVDGNRSINSKLGMPQKSGKIFTKEEMELLKSIPSKSIVKGDSKYLSIAAASILAKTYRDDYMSQIHNEYPTYNWKKNKGYPTFEHRKSIEKQGITSYHRKSFQLLSKQLKLEI